MPERGYPSGPAPDKLPPLPPSWPTKPSGVEQRILTAINSWPNRPWLFLPGPVDMAPSLAAHIAKALGARRIETVEELGALPHRALVRTPDGDIWERRGRIGRWDNLSSDGSGGLTYSRDVPIGDGALLLWEPA